VEARNKPKQEEKKKMKRKVVHKGDKFFRKMADNFWGLSYDDVLLKTQHSDVAPADVILKSKFSRNVGMNIPVSASPMDTVTDNNMAIRMALEGGIGIIPRSFSPKAQAHEVAKVKYHLTGRLIDKPICVRPTDSVENVLRMIEEKKYSFRSFAVVDEDEKLVGLLTGNDFDFCLDPKIAVSKIMTTELITAGENTTVQRAFKIMRKEQKKILPVVSSGGKLQGIYVYTDLKRQITGINEKYNIDADGRLRVGAAVGVLDDAFQRAELLVAKDVDVLVIDTAHGDTKNVIETLKKLKAKYPHLDIVAGNISTGEEALRLARAGADAVKVGQGPGAICTTRVVSGNGRAQLTAVWEIAWTLRGSGVLVIADGGIKYSGCIVKALAAGADSVMVGSMLAGTTEAPGDIIMINGSPHKSYRGMGSLGAMEASQASRERYGQTENAKDKLVPEGVEGAVKYKGDVAKVLYQMLGGVRSGMGYSGATTIIELQKKALFEYITPGVQKESHPHSIVIIKDAPNYSKE